MKTGGKPDLHCIRDKLDESLFSFHEKLDSKQISELLSILVDEINSDNTELQQKSNLTFKKLLSVINKSPTPQIAQIINNSGIIQRLIQLLYNHDVPKLQYGIIEVLDILTSGALKQTNTLIEHGAIQVFILLLNSKTANDDLIGKVTLILGNIADDSTTRDLILGQNALQPIINILQRSTPPVSNNMVNNATKTISNLCRGKPSPPFEIVGILLPILCKLINYNDDKVIDNVCCALSYISEGSNESIKYIIDSDGVCQRLVSLLNHYSDDITKIPTLRTIANILSGNENQIQVILDLQVFPHFVKLLESQKWEIRIEVYRAILNITTSGNSDQIQQVIDNLIPALYNVFGYSDSKILNIKKDAAQAITNITGKGTPQQIKYLVDQNCFNPLCDLMYSTKDTDVINIVLKAFENILEAGKKEASETDMGNNTIVNPYIKSFENARGIGIINKILHNINEENVDNCNKVVKLLKNK